ncbi:regulator of ribosome biosynthesis [Nematocida sp. LUAm3]|nr:regulator of ribosome biosynthesis [Nematocida sp. LUAm3]KAI5174769.1 regulator of ribosome biosynthesis [Nematocida sp. LUAm2]KAI5177820.1 regulator of ribosome biosynthesis [Nematocida sp. LUAm1]
MPAIYDVKNFIAIADADERSTEERHKELALNLLKAVVELPTKYDLFSEINYILPSEILPTNPNYSKETVFPRIRVLPEEAPKTKWELFAQMKGIKKDKNKKRGGRIYDDDKREFTPAYGRGSKNDLDRNWLIEIKSSEDPMVDRHKLLKKEKKDRKTKQNKNEMGNLKKSQKLSHFQKEL